MKLSKHIFAVGVGWYYYNRLMYVIKSLSQANINNCVIKHLKRYCCPNDLYGALDGRRAGDKVTVGIVRNDKPMRLVFELTLLKERR